MRVACVVVGVLGLNCLTAQLGAAQAQGRLLVAVRVVDTRVSQTALRAAADVTAAWMAEPVAGAPSGDARRGGRRRDVAGATVRVEESACRATRACAGPVTMTIVYW